MGRWVSGGHRHSEQRVLTGEEAGLSGPTGRAVGCVSVREIQRHCLERLPRSPLGEVSLEPPGDGSGGEERRPVVRTYGCSGLEVLLGVRRSGTWFSGKETGQEESQKKGREKGAVAR